GADLCVSRPGREVSVRFLVREPLDPTFDPYLPAERTPVEEQRRLRVRLELASLARRVMRVEDETALVETLQQHHPRRRRSARGRCGQSHRLRHLDRRLRLAEPAPELLERVEGEVGAP